MEYHFGKPKCPSLYNISREDTMNIIERLYTTLSGFCGYLQKIRTKIRQYDENLKKKKIKQRDRLCQDFVVTYKRIRPIQEYCVSMQITAY